MNLTPQNQKHLTLFANDKYLGCYLPGTAARSDINDALKQAGIEYPGSIALIPLVSIAKLVLKFDVALRHNQSEVTCSYCGNYFPGHATGAGDVCDCPQKP